MLQIRAQTTRRSRATWSCWKGAPSTQAEEAQRHLDRKTPLAPPSSSLHLEPRASGSAPRLSAAPSSLQSIPVRKRWDVYHLVGVGNRHVTSLLTTCKDSSPSWKQNKHCIWMCPCAPFTLSAYGCVYMCLFACLLVCLFACLFVCLFVCLSLFV